jgi:lipopolysaccharide transport system ATP-binding protein
MVLEASSNLEKASGFDTGQAQLVAVTLEKLDADESPVFKGGERVRVRVRARALQPLARPIIGFIVRDRLGQDLFGENTLGVTALRDCRVEAGQEVVGTFVFRLPMLPNGQYSVMSSVADGDQFDNVQHHYLHDALILTVSSAKVRYGLVGIGYENVDLQVGAAGSQMV